jgi:hypothetical protein
MSQGIIHPLPLAERYHAFREQVWEGSAAAEPGTLGLLMPSELQLQSQWFAGAFGTHFNTVDGQSVVIRDFGYWNSGPGADFTGCSILLDGEKISGDIELDPDVRDWERHGHAQNVEFNRVVLHLYFTAAATRSFTRTQGQKAVPQVQLSLDALQADLAKPHALASAHLGRCALPLRDMDESRVKSLIQCAAQYRLQRKSRRLHAVVAAQGREQALYQSLGSTLGYKNNTETFSLLTQRLPLWKLAGMDPVEREALLYGVAGFTEDTAFDETREDTRGYLRRLWEHWWKQRGAYARWLQPGQRLPWKLAATRPGNHPQRRLAALAAMLSAWGKMAHGLYQPEKWHRQTWVQLVAGLSHDYWSTHYTLLAQPAQKPLALIGETRATEMLANVVYPLLVPEREDLWAEYTDLPARLGNQKVERAQLRLFGPGSEWMKTFDRKLFHHQGLLQIYEDFCLEDDSACQDCPFPERLSQW